MLTATRISDQAEGALLGTVVLAFQDRYRRRIQLSMRDGTDFLLHLPEVQQLGHGAFLICETGCIQIEGAQEAVLEIREPDPAKFAAIAWHLGNRHLPIQILDAERLRLADDPVIADMLRTLGTNPVSATAVFAPQGGAYGAGPTQGHSHG